MHINVKVYGTQTVKVRCGKPEQVVSDSKGLIIVNLSYQEEKGTLNIIVKAKDMQGEKGNIIIRD
jgi:hypothetical protein